MKPLTEKTYVDQALRNGKGCTWLDDGRTPINKNNERRYDLEPRSSNPNYTIKKSKGTRNMLQPRSYGKSTLQRFTRGRFPANLICGSGIDINIQALLDAKRILNEKTKCKM
jgi:hypothetical protein